MSIDHKDIIDSERHEPKGASTATSGQVVKSNGDGTTSFGFISYSELSGSPPPGLVLDSESSSSVNQPCSTNETVYTVSFGAGDTGDFSEIDSSGIVTFNEDGLYLVYFKLTMGMISGSAGTTHLFWRELVNDAQVGYSSVITFHDNSDETAPITSALYIQASAGDTYELEMARSGADTVGVVTRSIPAALLSAGWSSGCNGSVIRVFKVG